MTRRVVITGIGLATPAGHDAKQTWENVESGTLGSRLIESFDPSAYRSKRAGIVDKLQPRGVSNRFLKRMDRFSQLAMSASAEAIEDANIDLQSANRERIGAYLGNMYGGWEITDPSLRGMLQKDYWEVSPYVASAWFPTAPQGQITIHWQLKGYSKTISADTASSALAIGYGARLIQEDRADAMLCGGSEAPITPYTYLFCDRSGRLSPDGYRPFTPAAAGFQVGEGAAILMLEEREAARKRGAHIYAELAGFAVGRAGGSGRDTLSNGEALKATMGRAIEEAGRDPLEVDYLALDAQAAPESDSSEALAISALMGGVRPRVPCTTSKPSTTHLLGASAAVETAVCALAMRHGRIPPVAGLREGSSLKPLDLVSGESRPAEINLAVVNARGADGTAATLALRSEDSWVA